MATRVRKILIVLLALSAMAAAQTVNPQKLDDLRQWVPADAVDVRTMELGPELWAVSWTEWQGVTVAKSHVLVIQTPRAKPFHVVWDSGPFRGEGTAIQPYPQFKFDGHPLVFVSVTTGLRQTELFVLGSQEKSVRVLLHTNSAGFDVEPMGKQKLPVLVEHFDPSMIDVPQLYRWTGEKFCDCSREFPEFYKFRYQSYGMDWQTFTPSIAINFARLAWLGGNTELAREALAQARKQLSNKSDTLSETTRRQLDGVTAEIARGHGATACGPE